jgi:hypothetical protein
MITFFSAILPCKNRRWEQEGQPNPEKRSSGECRIFPEFLDNRRGKTGNSSPNLQKTGIDFIARVSHHETAGSTT